MGRRNTSWVLASGIAKGFQTRTRALEELTTGHILDFLWEKGPEWFYT
jgi:hypothetical protein